MLNEAIETITASLKKDDRVRAVFLKGSFGRGEEDEHSDIDLYCFVDDGDVESFLKDRLNHLQSYGDLLFHDDIFIIAPQIIAVFEDMTHVDLFTVSEDTYINKDYMKILYDPENRLEAYKNTQNLSLSESDFQDAVDDTAWFLFQYKKAAARGNDVWSVNMLHHVMINLARVLLHRYNPGRAQLGLKASDSSLPTEVNEVVRSIYEHLTPTSHGKAVQLICQLLLEVEEWAFMTVADSKKTKPLWDKMVQFFTKEDE